MSKLYINDKEIQLPEKFEISFTIQLSDASEPSAVKNNYSQNVTVEATPENTEVLGLFFECDATVNGNSFNPRIRNSFTLLDDNCNVFQAGYCKMISATTKGKKTEYTLTLYGLLGDLFYNLQTDEFGEEMNLGDLLYKPFDYPDDNGNIDDWSDVVWNARYLRGLSNYLERTDGNKRFRANKGVGYCFTNSGLYPDFDNNKVVLGWMNKDGDEKYEEFRSYIPPIKQEFNGSTLTGIYLPYVYNNQAYTLLEYNQDFKDYELGNYCAHYMRPTFYLPMVLEACSNPDNNGGYEVEWDETILDSLEYKNAWLLLDRLNFGENTNIFKYNAVIRNRHISVSDWTTTNVTKIENPNPDDDSNFVYDCTSMRYPSLFTRPLAFLQVDSTIVERIFDGYFPALNGQVTRSYTVDTNRIYMGGMIIEVEAYDYYTNEVYATDYRFLTTPTLLLSEDRNISMITGVIDPNTHQGNDTVYGKAYNILLAMILGQIGFDKREKYLSINRNIYADFQLDYFFGVTSEIPYQGYVAISTLPFELNLPWNANYIWGVVPNNCSTLAYRLKTRWINITYDANTQEYSWSYAPRLLYKDPSTSVWFYVPKASAIVNNVQEWDIAYPTDELTNSVYNSYGDTPAINGMNYSISKEFFFRNTKTPLEYLLSFTKMFNFKYITDNLNKKIKIVTSEEFYENKELVDLSDMVDYSKEIKVEPYIYDCKWLDYKIETPGSESSYLIGTNTNFNNDTKDILNNNIYQNVLKSVLRSNIGNNFFEGGNQIQPGIMWPINIKQTLYNSLDNNTPKTFELNGYYAQPFELQRWFDYSSIDCYTGSGENNSDINNAVIYYKPINTNTTKKKVYDTLPVTMDLNKKPCHFFPLNDTDIDGDNVLEPLYDCFVHRVYEDEPNYSGYYTKYWSTTIEQFVDPDCKRVTLYTRIPADIQQNELLRRFYFFNDSVWILEKIENYTITSDKPLKCTFIKIKDHQSFGKIIDIEYNEELTNG